MMMDYQIAERIGHSASGEEKIKIRSPPYLSPLPANDWWTSRR